MSVVNPGVGPTKMVTFRPLVKLIQRRCYSFVGSPDALDQVLCGILLLLALFVSAASIVGIHHRLLLSVVMGDSCLAAVDNLGGADFSPRLCHEPIDVVYTWVNGSDPVWFADMVRHKKRWLSERAAMLGDLSPSPSPSASPSSSPATANASLFNGSSLLVASAASEEDGVASMNRYRDNDELRYSVRSLFKYTPWVRYVHFVTNGQVPSWLDTEHPRVRVVTHADIFQNASHLPVFSSPSIEVHLHRIPGLSRRFVYLNDDVFFGTDTWPDDFFTHAQGQKVYLAYHRHQRPRSMRFLLGLLLH